MNSFFIFYYLFFGDDYFWTYFKLYTKEFPIFSAVLIISFNAGTFLYLDVKYECLNELIPG